MYTISYMQKMLNINIYLLLHKINLATFFASDNVISTHVNMKTKIKILYSKVLL